MRMVDLIRKKRDGGVLSDDTAMKILVKMAKQRRESAKIYQENNRPELAENELAEMAVIEEYLPKKLSADELEAELQKIIAEVGATSPQEMGKVMGVATKKLAGRADGKDISVAVRRLLAKCAPAPRQNDIARVRVQYYSTKTKKQQCLHFNR